MSVVFVADRSIGDPARMVLGETGTEEDLRELRERMGLEDPLHVQYARFVAGMATFDFGEDVPLRYQQAPRPRGPAGIAGDVADRPRAAAGDLSPDRRHDRALRPHRPPARHLGGGAPAHPRRSAGQRAVTGRRLDRRVLVRAHSDSALRGSARLAADLRIRHRGSHHPACARSLAPAHRAHHPDRAELDAGRTRQALRNRRPGPRHSALEGCVRPRAQECRHPHRHDHRRRDHQHHHRGHHHRDRVRLAGDRGPSPSTRSRSATFRSSRRRSSSWC